MPGPLAALERFFERLFERPAARLFRTRLQPVQLQRRLERVMEAERRHGADRTYVPNRYRVHLHPEDVAAFRGYQQTLEGELSDALLARARTRGYTLVDRPGVSLHADESVPPGEVHVEAELLDPHQLRPAVPEGFRRLDEERAPDRDHARTRSPAQLDQTAVFEAPAVRPPQISLLVRAPGLAPQRTTMDGPALRIGRASDNDIVLTDERVSRHHGQLASRQGTLVYTDLGSTNGSYVGGVAVTEIALGDGDELQLGDSTLTVQLER
ncbi:MAG: DUF3662 domain-containing protein [Chloroflexota bacterium]|nr:DUF3662 domain-containing protein [Chloroflexota bacterium]